jgi:hypothetical protein
VALIGGLGTVVLSGNHDGEGGGGSSGAALSPNRGAAGGVVRSPAASAQGAASRVHGAAAAARACPAAPVSLALPGGGGLGNFGSNDPLFSRDVAAITACGYAASGKHTRTVIIGAAARTTARTLESATASYGPGRACVTPTVATGTVELLPVDARGRNLRPVVVYGACPVRVTNGTAVRYPAALPPVVSALLRGHPR